MLRRVCVIAMVLALPPASCGSGISEPDDEHAPLHATAAGSSAETAATPARTSPPQCAPAPSIKLPQAPCTQDRECVLSDLPVACEACNLDRVYPVLRTEVAHRIAGCHASSGPTHDLCGQPCPEHDTYTGAFYRAECRDHRCVAYRYHGGG